MMELKRLDGFGQIASADYLATDEEVDEALENAFEQASQGWGVRREVGVYLTLVRELRVSLSLAYKTDEALRALKGEQLAHGRTKKALAGCMKSAQASESAARKHQQRYNDLTAGADKIAYERDELVAQRDSAEEHVASLQNKLANLTGGE